jgi:hypothetical protein
MTASESDQWPPAQYRLAPNDYLAALGQVTFVYNILESMMRNIFKQCSPVSKDFAAALFHKLGNRDRIDLLSEFVRENEKEEAVRDAILHCVFVLRHMHRKSKHSDAFHLFQLQSRHVSTR